MTVVRGVRRCSPWEWSELLLTGLTFQGTDLAH